MMRLALVYFLSVFTMLVAGEEDCLCGTVKNDRFYAKAVFLLNSAIRKTPFDFGTGFPKAANEFYPPFELRVD